nr:MazG-like family protein [Brucella anthropi]
MNMTNLRAANVARDQEWNTGSERVSMTFRATELAGEVGEACNVIKKLERERIGLVGSRDTNEHLAEELADIVICTDLVAMDAGIDLDAAIAAKFNATSEKNGLATRLSLPVLVTTLPFEETPAMVKAALDLVWEEGETHSDLVSRLWRAMAAVAPDQSVAARDVLAERRRQIEAEGWTPEHDDEHSNGEMARAALCYITAKERSHLPTVPLKWPWSDAWWKPDGYRRNLIKAGALILAEIERLDRLSASATEGEE